MTIQEAVKTGRPFKRPNHEFYMWFNLKGELCELGYEHSNETMSIYRDSMLATDWMPMNDEEWEAYTVVKNDPVLFKAIRTIKPT